MSRYTNACRICLKEDGINIPIFGEEGQYRKVSEKIRECLSITIYHADPLPKNICHKCYYKLDLAAELKAQSQRSNAIFIHFLSTQRGNHAASEYLKLVQDRPHVPTSSHSLGSVQKRKLPVTPSKVINLVEDSSESNVDKMPREVFVQEPEFIKIKSEFDYLDRDSKDSEADQNTITESSVVHTFHSDIQPNNLQDKTPETVFVQEPECMEMKNEIAFLDKDSETEQNSTAESSASHTFHCNIEPNAFQDKTSRKVFVQDPECIEVKTEFNPIDRESKESETDQNTSAESSATQIFHYDMHPFDIQGDAPMSSFQSTNSTTNTQFDLPNEYEFESQYNLNYSSASQRAEKYKNKLLRERGKPYVGICFIGNQKVAVLKDKKEMRSPCTSTWCAKSKYRACNTFTEQDRQQNYTEIWSRNWEGKKAFVNALIEKVPRGRIYQEVSSRCITLKYYLFKSDRKRYQVCQKMFCNTLCLSKSSVLSWVSPSKASKSLTPSTSLTTTHASEEKLTVSSD